MKIKLTGMTFDVANRRGVEWGGEVIGDLWISRGHNWGGSGTSYRFHPNDKGKAMNLEYFSGSHVSKIKKRLEDKLQG